MFNKFKKWFNEGNEKALGKMEKIQVNNNDKVTKHLNDFMSTTGLSKGIAKGKLFGTNRVSKTFPHMAVDYVGGHPESPEGKEDIEVILLPQGIFLYNFEDVVPYSEVKGVSYKTESEVHSDVTLARMIAFGMYSLAMKKKKKVITNYLILDCEKNGMNYSMVFGGKDIHSLYMNLFKKMANN